MNLKIILITAVLFKASVLEYVLVVPDLHGPAKSSNVFKIKPEIKAESTVYIAQSNCFFNAYTNANTKELDYHNQFIDDLNKCVGVKLTIKF